jgi:HD-GYP domain-containing protein (c-di-GMP phosphodiesterase class II)
MSNDVSGPLRLSELVAALSLITDLGMGQPMEQAMVTCLLAVNAGRELGLADDVLSEVYYLALLRFIGCSADASEFAAEVGGDDIGQRAALAPVLNADNAEILLHVIRHFGAGSLPLRRLQIVGLAVVKGEQNSRKSIAEHCAVAQMLAPRIGISPAVARYVGSTFERWDGKGTPGELAAEAIPVPCRIVAVARDVEVLGRMGGWDTAAACLQERSGKAYDPAIADLFRQQGERWLEEITSSPVWDLVIASEPARPAVVAGAHLDEVLCAFADLGDLKAPYSAGHSRGVAEIAENAGRSVGLNDREVASLRRAALLHDIGKAGVPNAILDKPGPLTSSEWERVRLHPYYTERVLSYVTALRHAGTIAGSHHERLDGSGYHHGVGGEGLSTASRVLAAANAYQALTQARPYRAALDAAGRERELRRLAGDGKLDPPAVSAVLESAGHPALRSRSEWPAGLTDREVEVLRLIARGHSNRSVARELTISVKTVGRHVENIYGKTGATGRATAALFAMEHGII